IIRHSNRPLNQPSSLFPQPPASRKLSTIEEKTELVTTIQESKLASRLLRPTSTLSRSSSSDGSKESDIKDLAASEEEKIDQEDSFVTKNRRVYNHNIDAISRILEEKDINVLATEQIGEGDGNSENKDTSNNPTCRTNINLSIPTIFTSSEHSSEHSSADISTLLPSLSVDLDSTHSDKSILGDAYSAIKDDYSDVSVSLYPSPVPISNVTPLRNFKDGRIGIREERYPSPKTYFTHRNGPMGDLSGVLSPHKRSRFIPPPNRIDRLPVPSIDTSRPERSMSGRMAMEGWPTSPRRMQLASPRFNSLTDLEEGPEGSEQQQESPSLRANPISSQYSSSAAGSNNVGGRTSPPIPSKLGLNAITELESQNNNDILSSGNFSTKSTRLGELQQSDNEMPSSPSLASSQPSETSQPVLSSSKRNLGGVSKPFVHESMGLGIVAEEIQDDKNSKGSSEKRSSGSFTLKLGEIEEESEETEQQLEQKQPELIKSTSNRKTRTIFSKETHTEEPRSESIRKSTSAKITRRLFPSIPSIQSRRTATHMLTVKTPLPMLSETEDEEDAESSTTSARQELIRSPDQSDTSPFPSAPATPSTLLASTTPASVKSMTSWRWPKRPFSPAREKHKESQNQDNPADHIGKVGNIWAKKTLGQLRKYHQRHSPSILGRKFGLASPVKESHNSLQSPVSDISDSKKSQTVQVLEETLETINEEDEDDEIGIWSSEEVDLTEPCTDEKKIQSPTSMNVLNQQIIEEVVEEPHGMRVSPEYLTVVGGPSVNAASPNASSTSLSLRSNPSSSSLAKHNAKPLFETTFTISNNTDEPLRYEILWPAFRFDVSPAYGIVKAQSVTVVKISVMNKHFAAGARRDETKDSRRLMGILKGSESNDYNKPLMGRTRILVLCENGERKEVVVDIVQVKKKAKGEVEAARSSKNVKNSEDGSFIRRSISQKVDNLIRAAKAARTKKTTKIEDKSRSAGNKGKSSVSISKAPGSTVKSISSSATKKSILSGHTSRSSSPESNNKYPGIRKYPSTTSIRSRPNTPDTYRQIVSPLPGTRSRTPDESKSGKQFPQRKNFIYIGVPGNISCPTTVIRETNHSVFRIHNPTNKPVTWHLTTATNPFLRRSDTTNSAQKINEEVFLIMKTSGLLRAGQTERVDISFRPIFIGTYYQSFMLEDSISSEGSGGLGGVSVRIQGEGKADVSNPIKADTKKSGSKLMDFEVSESEIQIPATRIGRRRSVGININNPSNQLVRIKCKCEVIGNTSGSNLSIPLSSVQIKPRASVTLPVRFQPKEVGETRAVVKLQAVGRAEVLVDVIAKGVQDTPIATET
ncbi:7262_t:CDS:2, partial [Dentiscutata heterogama]